MPEEQNNNANSTNCAFEFSIWFKAQSGGRLVWVVI